MVNGRRYNCTDQTSPTQFIVPTEPWLHCHHHHRHAPPPAAVVVCKDSIVHPAAATRHLTSMQELVVNANAPSTKRHLRCGTLARKKWPYHNHGRSVASSSSSSSSSSSLSSPPSSPPSPVIYLIFVFFFFCYCVLLRKLPFLELPHGHWRSLIWRFPPSQFLSKIWFEKPQILCQSCPHEIVNRAPPTRLASKNPLCFAR